MPVPVLAMPVMAMMVTPVKTRPLPSPITRRRTSMRPLTRSKPGNTDVFIVSD